MTLPNQSETPELGNTLRIKLTIQTNFKVQTQTTRDLDNQNQHKNTIEILRNLHDYAFKMFKKC